ncbi:MAG: hypothetical protein BRD28_06450 [Bacteroidetes bacterium QH_10_64_37]|nr:MAG: hypothetical protein BRD28_06450 [Bacteroidetes bacterium QH_10_64_37]
MATAVSGDSFRTSRRIGSGRSGGVDSRHYPTLRAGPDGVLLVLRERFLSWKKRPQGLGFAL